MLGPHVDVVIVLELCKREKVNPFILTLIDKDLEVLLKLLVDSLGLSIALRMVGSGGS